MRILKWLAIAVVLAAIIVAVTGREHMQTTFPTPAPASSQEATDQQTLKHAQTQLAAMLEQSSQQLTGLAGFQAKTHQYQANAALAYAAAQCGLRSDAWLNVILMANQLAGEKYSQQFKLSDAEWQAAKIQSEKTLKETIASVTCTSLRNSPVLDTLDLIERNLTGNYH